MKKSILYSASAVFIFICANFISSTNAQDKVEKFPGAIVIGVPPGCDCTAPANTCYCEVKVPQPPPPPPEG